MEFSAKVSEIVSRLELAAQAADKKSTIPILSHVMLNATEGSVLVTASDLEISIRTSCPAKVKKAGSCTVPSAKLLSILRLLLDEEVRFKVLENKWVQITSDRKTYKLVGMSGENFPIIPNSPKASCKITAATFAELAGRVSFAISKEGSRYTLNGALLSINGSASLVATDGHRLAMANSDALLESKETTALIPRNALDLVANSVKDLPEEAVIAFASDATHLFFECPEWRIAARVLTGKFPNYEAVLPKDNKTVLTVDRKELQAALRRVGQMADSRSHAVKLAMHEGELEVSSVSPEYGEAREMLALPGNATKGLSIGFNALYLLDFISRVESESVTIALKDDQSAGELRAVGDANCRYVVMPMRV